MKEIIRIAELFQKSFEGNSWHGPSVLEALANVNAEMAAAKSVSSAHSMGEIARHISLWQNTAHRRILGEITEPTDDDDWNTSFIFNDETWKQSLIELKTGYQNLYATILLLDDTALEKNVAGKMTSAYETLHGVIHHNIYHAGQISLLKKEYTLRDPLRMLDAAEKGNPEKIKKILQRNPALVHICDKHNKTPLHLAAENNHIEAAQLLLASNAAIEAETSWGMTPLQWAANCGNQEVADLLISTGAKINLWTASALGKLEDVKSYWKNEIELFENIGQPSAQHSENDEWQKLLPSESYAEIISDAFYIACRNGNVATAEFLLAKGADINCKGFYGGTGLHWAALNGHCSMVQFLLTHNANTQIKDDEYELTAYEWAKEGAHQDCITLLEPPILS
ncbi:MAG: DinB family protein [Bacteroidota bacterium]